MDPPSSRARRDPPPSGSSRPQSPASRGLRAGLLGALAAAFLVLAANDSWLLPALDEDGVAYLVVAEGLARGEADPRVPVLHWSADEGVEGPGAQPKVVAAMLATAIDGGVRGHVAALWLLAGSLAVLALAVGWVVGGGSGTGGGILACGLLLVSPLAVESATSLRPEPLTAALLCLQLGLMTYRPRWHPVHGGLGALAWSLHPAGAGGVAAAAAAPLLPAVRTAVGAHPTPGPASRASEGDRPSPAAAGRGAVGAVLGALAPALLLLVLGPAVGWLPALPPVVDGAGGGGALAGAMRWAGGGLAGWTGLALGTGVLVALGAAALLDAGATPPVEPHLPWDHPRARDVVAGRARVASGLLILGVAVAATAAGRGRGSLEAPEILLVGPLAVLGGMSLARWAARAGGGRRLALGGVVLAWLALSGAAAWGRGAAIRDEGRGLTAARWVDAETIRWLDNRAPPGMVIYASSPHLVLVQTGRAARTLPGPGRPLDGFASAFARRPGAVVLTGADTVRSASFAALLALERVVRGREGHVLAPGEPAAGR